MTNGISSPIVRGMSDRVWAALRLALACAFALTASPSIASATPMSGASSPQRAQSAITLASVGPAYDGGVARLEARFAPTLSGRKLLVQQRSDGSSWSTISTINQPASGSLPISDPIKSGTSKLSYRVVAPKTVALPRVVSNVVKVRVRTGPTCESVLSTSECATLLELRDPIGWDLSQSPCGPLEAIVCVGGHVTALDLYGDFSHLPDSIGNLTSLKSLSVRASLTDVPDNIGTLTALQDLDLSGNQLASVPNTIGNLTDLEWLALDGNALTSLPDSITHLQQLQRLILDDNHLTELPAAIGDLTSLRIISLTGNMLAALPESIGQLNKVATLDLEGNALAELPPTLGGMTGLTELVLDDNALTSLPASVGDLLQLATLRARHNQLASIPASMSNLHTLVTLDLSENRLTALPDSLSALSTLGAINLASNSFTEVPVVLGAIPNLSSLTLDNNPLTLVPGWIGDLGNLRNLDLSGLPEGTALPADLGCLVQLQSISLANDQMSSVPTWLTAMPKLRFIDLSDNQLTSVPATVATLRLRNLDLENNLLSGDITSWAKPLKRHSPRVWLYLSGNGCMSVVNAKLAIWLADTGYDEAC